MPDIERSRSRKRHSAADFLSYAKLRQNHQLLAGEALVFLSGVGWWHGHLAIVFFYLLAQVVEALSVADVELGFPVFR